MSQNYGISNNNKIVPNRKLSPINKKAIKFIPDTKEIFSKNLKVDYYELFPVLSLQKTQLQKE